MATKGKINVDFVMRYIGALRANRIVANPNRYSTINYKDIVAYASRAAHVPESSVEVAMDALYDALSYFVLNGHNVKIDGLGTFFFGINAYAQEQMEDAGADAVHRLKIGYLPEKDLREQLNNVAVTTTYTNPGNLPVDPNVAPIIEQIDSMQSQTSSALKAMSFGSTHEIPTSGLFIRVTGALLDRIDSITGQVNLAVQSSDDPEWFPTEQDAVITVVAQNSKNLILKVDYPSFEAEEGNTYKAYMHQLVLKAGSKQVLNRYYTSPGEGRVIEKIVIFAGTKTSNGKIGTGDFVNLKGGLTAIPKAQNYHVSIYGANLANYAGVIGVFFDPAKMSVDPAYNASNTRLDAWFTPLVEQIPYGSGSNCFVPEGTMVFNLSETEGDSTPVVASLTANGISVANGGSSTVQAGQSYDFVFAGANLGSIAQSDLVVPQGASISNFSASASQVKFRLTIGSVGGNIGINYNGTSLFSVSVSIPANIAASITSIGGVSNNGTLQVTPDGRTASVIVAGTGLDGLSASNFVMSGYTMALNEGTATQRQLTITAENAFSGGTLLVQVDGTTIFTVTLDTGDEVSF